MAAGIGSAILSAVGRGAASGAKRVAGASARGALSLAKKTPGFLMKASGADSVPILRGAYNLSTNALGSAVQAISKLSESKKSKIGPPEPEPQEKTTTPEAAAPGKQGDEVRDAGEKLERENKEKHDKLHDEVVEKQGSEQTEILRQMADDIAEIKENTSDGIGGSGEGEGGGFLDNLKGMLTGVLSMGAGLLTGRFSTMFRGLTAGLTSKLTAGFTGVFSKASSLLTNASKSLVGVLGSIKDRAAGILKAGRGLVQSGLGAAKGIVSGAISKGGAVVNSARALAITAGKHASTAWDVSKSIVKSQGWKGAAKFGAKKIPLVGALAGLGFAANRAYGGDWTGAGMEAASGLASTIPVIGTAASVALDAGLIKRDYDAANPDAPPEFGVDDVIEPPKASIEPAKASPTSTVPEFGVDDVIDPPKAPGAVQKPSLPVQQGNVQAAPAQPSQVTEAASVGNRTLEGIHQFLRVIAAKMSMLANAALDENTGIFARIVRGAFDNPNIRTSGVGTTAPKPSPSQIQPRSVAPGFDPATGKRVSDYSIGPVSNQQKQLEWETPDGSSLVGEGGVIDRASVHAPLLDLIASKESGAAGYDAAWNGSKVKPPKPLSEMTFAEVKQWQKDTLNEQKSRGIPADRRSSAAGRYQFISSTLAAMQEKSGLADDAMFNQENQDKLALALLDSDKKRGLAAFESGKATSDQLQDYVASQWASIKDSKGLGVYDAPGFNASHDVSERFRAATARSSANLTAAMSEHSVPLKMATIEERKQNQPVVTIPSVAPPAPSKQPMRGGSSNPVPNVAMITRNPDSAIRDYSRGVMKGNLA